MVLFATLVGKFNPLKETERTGLHGDSIALKIPNGCFLLYLRSFTCASAVSWFPAQYLVSRNKKKEKIAAKGDLRVTKNGCNALL